METQIVEFFHGFSSKIGDLFFSFTNILGEDLFFYLIFFALCWVYGRNFALKYGLVYFVSFGVNFAFKHIVKRPRPYLATEDGYSFPSGHSQSFSASMTGLVYEAKKNNYYNSKLIKVDLLLTTIIFGALVGIGRMYFGQHYLTDVLAGLVLGVIVTVAATYCIDLLIDRLKKVKLSHVLLVVWALAIILYIVLAATKLGDKISDIEKAYRFIGIYSAVVLGYFVDKKWIHYEVKDTTKNNILKIMVGEVVLAIIYAFWLVKVNSDVFMPLHYFAAGLIPAVILPYIFKTIKNEPENYGGRR